MSHKALDVVVPAVLANPLFCPGMCREELRMADEAVLLAQSTLKNAQERQNAVKLRAYELQSAPHAEAADQRYSGKRKTDDMPATEQHADTADLLSEEVGANMCQANMPCDDMSATEQHADMPCSSKVTPLSFKATFPAAARQVNPLSSLCIADFAHRTRATLTSENNAQLFDEAWCTLALQHRSMLENIQITAADALLVFNHLGAAISINDICEKSLWQTPGNMFYSPAVYRGWVPAKSGETASVTPECLVMNAEKGYHCTSLTCGNMILNDCMRNGVHTSGKHFKEWEYFDDGQKKKIYVPNDGVYYEKRHDRIHCCARYGALQCLRDDVLPHKPGVMVQCIFELHADPKHAHYIHKQRYCLEEHVCVTGLYLNLVPAMRLFDKGFGGHYNVCDSFKVDFPRVAAYMQSTAFVSQRYSGK